MQAPQLSDTNVIDYSVLPAPELLCREIARPEPQANFIAQAREEINRIIFGDDRRLLVVVGPCSIHDTQAGLDYARRLAELAPQVQDRLKLVMRVYFEKPRTTVGWKGLIMDPDLDGTANIHDGLKVARQFLLDVLDLKLPTATEFLDPITPQYIADLVCWAAIGARTTESQTHRQMASGLSMPLGFKNGTSGDIKVAINAIKAASQPQTFLGISHQGLASAVSTRGNPYCHLILRGGDKGPNYDAPHVADSAELLRKAGLKPAVMVDCSHGNSNKDHRRQPEVFGNLLDQSLDASSSVIGAMIESNLEDGNQPFPQPIDQLAYGRSITDACIDWDTTERIISEAYEKIGPRFA
ncbi:MAG: 3-deoxy-7-phosphoheptulonate synthase [Puniceicoccaceae bacterium 5H]|nr:MAG: 3-deoxy-7-phosphoheptulonate synthase [Puniceicoccaceae bacterium 5H]